MSGIAVSGKCNHRMSDDARYTHGFNLQNDSLLSPLLTVSGPYRWILGGSKSAVDMRYWKYPSSYSCHVTECVLRPGAHCFLDFLQFRQPYYKFQKTGFQQSHSFKGILWVLGERGWDSENVPDFVLLSRRSSFCRFAVGRRSFAMQKPWAPHLA